MPLVALLGPQRFQPTLGAAVRSFGVTGRLASVTAGWQEREAEDLELHEHLGERTTNLQLYARGEDVAERDPELFRAHRERQERLKELQALYRLRLTSALEAVRQLEGASGPADLLESELQAAIDELRRLDKRHLERVLAVDEAFDREHRPAERPVVVHHRRAIARLLDRTEAVAIAGGHVAILLNRLRMFGVDRELERRPVFAWSAGAMAISERVVLFHDSPPQGSGDPEVLHRGLGLVRGIVPLPHARRRLHLDDHRRVGRFARRFAPALALAMDDGCRVEIRPEGWRIEGGVWSLTPAGAVLPLEAS